MAIVSYPTSSPYSSTPQTSWYLSLYVTRNIRPASDDMTITLSPRYNYRPTVLSQDLYSTPAYWWVFYARNLDIIRDPLWDFVSGITIIAPSAKTLKSMLGS